MRWLVPTTIVIALLVAPVAGAAPDPHGAIDGPADPVAGVQPPVRATPPGRTFTVAAVGDWLAENLVNNAAAAAAPPGVRFDHEPLLRAMTPLVQWADLAICHMETPIGEPGDIAGYAGKGPYGYNKILAPYELAGDLHRVGFDRCSTASNHANDLGTAGIGSTLDALDEAGIGHAGTARTQAEAAPAAHLLTVNGVTVAHLSYARNSNSGWPAEDWRIDKAVTATKVVQDVAAARAAGAEVVIVSLHVFVEMQTGPTADDRTLVQQITSLADVDLVLVTGPHVIQPYEQVNGTWVFWSLGNFISGMGVANRGKYTDPRTLDGLMATARFTEQPDGSWLVEPWALLVCNVTGSRKVYPGITTLQDPALGTTLRTQLHACVNRTLVVELRVH